MPVIAHVRINGRSLSSSNCNAAKLLRTNSAKCQVSCLTGEQAYARCRSRSYTGLRNPERLWCSEVAHPVARMGCLRRESSSWSPLTSSNFIAHAPLAAGIPYPFGPSTTTAVITVSKSSGASFETNVLHGHDDATTRAGCTGARHRAAPDSTVVLTSVAPRCLQPVERQIRLRRQLQSHRS